MSLLLKSLGSLVSLEPGELANNQRLTIITADGMFNTTLGTLGDAITGPLEARLATLEQGSGGEGSGPGPSIWPIPRTLTLTGLVTGSVSFDGSSNMSLLTSVADGAIAQAKVSGLTAKLNEIGTAANNRWGTGYTIGPSPSTYGGDLDQLSGATFLQTQAGNAKTPDTGADFTILSNGPLNNSHQLALRAGEMWVRSQGTGAWANWRKFWTSDNLDPSLLLLKTDTASMATKLATARGFSLTGPVTAASVQFDGTGNVVLATAIADGTLSIAKVSGLQTALNNRYELKGQIAANLALNTLVASGLYVQARMTDVTTANNYPIANVTGIVRVTTQGTYTVQEFITNANVQYRRVYDGTSWSNWNKAWSSVDFDPNSKMDKTGGDFTGGITAPGLTVFGDLTANAMYAGSYQSRGDDARWIIQSLASEAQGFTPRGGLWQDDTGISLVSNFDQWVPLSITNDGKLFFNNKEVFDRGNYDPTNPVPMEGLLQIGDPQAQSLRLRFDGSYSTDGTNWRQFNEQPDVNPNPRFQSVSLGTDSDIRLYEDTTAGQLTVRTGDTVSYNYFDFGANGDFRVRAGRVFISGNEAWHTGNFNPALKLDASATAVAATKLATARKINGVNFDGTGDITITAQTVIPDSPTITGRTFFDVNNGTSSQGVIRENGTNATGISFDAINADNTGFVPLNLSASVLTYNNQTVWYAGNFDPSTKANVNNASFTGTVVSTTGSFRAQGWGGVATNGVYYLGSGDSYILKAGTSIGFKNVEGGWSANLTSGGVIWTGDNFTPGNKQDYRAALDVAAATHTDWNTAINNGWWMGNGAANAPVATGWFLGTVTRHNADWIQQEVYNFTEGGAVNGAMWRRWKLAGTWGAWTQDLTINGTFAAKRIASGWDSGLAGSISCSNWFRTTGQTGLYFSDYGGGLYMTDTTYVRTYNGRAMAAAFFESSASHNPQLAADQAAFRASGNFGGGFGMRDGAAHLTLYSVYGNLNFGFGQNGASSKASLDSGGTFHAVGYANDSDRKLKQDITDLSYTGRLRPVSFTWIKDGVRDFGFIAQEVQALYPDAVITDPSTGVLQLLQPKLVAVVAKQANQTEDRVVALEKELSDLRHELRSLCDLVQTLRTQP